MEEEDAILEPDVEERVQAFFRNGGRPERVVETLSGSFRGYAAMCNRLAQWLVVATGASKSDVEQCVTDVVDDLVLRVFDPRKADSLFLRQVRVPNWLDELTSAAARRRLIYELRRRHPSCQMLDFLVRKTAEHGYPLEMADLPGAYADFAVFNRILEAMLPLALFAPLESDAELPPHVMETACSHSEYTYLYSLIVLLHVYDLTGQSRVLSLIDRLERANPAREGICRRLRYLATGLVQYPDLFDALNSMCTAGACNQGDLNKIVDLYTATSIDKPAPPIFYLQDPSLVEILTRELFDPAAEAISDSADLYYRVYGLAMERQENREVAFRAIRKVHGHLRRNFMGTELELCSDELRDAVRHVSIAYGVLHWASKNLCDPERYANPQCSPLYAELIERCVYHHPALALRALECVCLPLEKEFTMDLVEITRGRRDLIETVVYLMQLGCVEPVLRRLHQWMRSWDPSLMAVLTTKISDILPTTHPLHPLLFQPVLEFVQGS